MSRRRRSSTGGPAWGLWALGGAAVVALGWYLLRDDPEAAPETADELIVSGGGGGLVVSTSAAAIPPRLQDRTLSAMPVGDPVHLVDVPRNPPTVDVPRNPPGGSPDAGVSSWFDRYLFSSPLRGTER